MSIASFRRLPRLLGVLTVAAVAAWSGPAAAAFSWTDVAEEVIAALDEAATHQEAGDAKAAKRAVTRAYFGVFEGRKMEAGMRKMLGQSHAFLVERKFGALRKTTSGDSETFAALVEELSGQLREDAKALDAAGVPEEVYDAR